MFMGKKPTLNVFSWKNYFNSTRSGRKNYKQTARNIHLPILPIDKIQ